MLQLQEEGGEIMKSVYLINPNRIREDFSTLIWYADKGDSKNMYLRADIIVEEIETLLNIIRDLKN